MSIAVKGCTYARRGAAVSRPRELLNDDQVVFCIVWDITASGVLLFSLFIDFSRPQLARCDKDEFCMFVDLGWCHGSPEDHDSPRHRGSHHFLAEDLAVGQHGISSRCQLTRSRWTTDESHGPRSQTEKQSELPFFRYRLVTAGCAGIFLHSMSSQSLVSMYVRILGLNRQPIGTQKA